MIRAILDGRKTQTRRIVKPQPDRISFEFLRDVEGGKYGKPGDLLWVRESWAAPHAFDHLPPRLIPAGTNFHYRATEDGPSGLLWRSSIHMPRWASRITCELIDVQVERLQDISDEDVIAEGVRCDHDVGNSEYDRCDASPREHFAELWASLHGPGSWEANPYVRTLSFQTHFASEK